MVGTKMTRKLEKSVYEAYGTLAHTQNVKVAYAAAIHYEKRLKCRRHGPLSGPKNRRDDFCEREQTK